MSDGQAEEDVLAVIRRHCRSISIALAAIDLAHPGAAVVTERMRSTLAVLTYDLGEVRTIINSISGPPGAANTRRP